MTSNIIHIPINNMNYINPPINANVNSIDNINRNNIHNNEFGEIINIIIRYINLLYIICISNTNNTSILNIINNNISINDLDNFRNYLPLFLNRNINRNRNRNRNQNYEARIIILQRENNNLLRENNEMEIVTNNLLRENNEMEIVTNNLLRENNEMKREIEINDQHIPENLTCCVCLTKQRTHLNVSCGHMSSCENCTNQLHNICPICREPGNFIRVIVS